MKHLTLSDLYLNPREALSLTTAALRTDGTLVEWSSEKNAVYTPGAANGSRIIIDQASGSLSGKQIRDSASGGPNTVQFGARARLRNRNAGGADADGINGLFGHEIPILNAGFTMMYVADVAPNFLFGYNTGGGNSPFGLRVATNTNQVLFQLGRDGGAFVSFTVDSKKTTGGLTSGAPWVWCISCEEQGSLLVAMDDQYAARSYDFPHDFGANTHADFGSNNSSQPIQFNYGGSRQQHGYFRVADVAYTEAQLLAWRDFLCQYWLGRVPSP